MNDTERLDALGLYGLCVVSHDTYSSGEWQRVWVAQYGERILTGPSIRDVIDAAVLDLKTLGLTCN